MNREEELQLLLKRVAELEEEIEEEKQDVLELPPRNYPKKCEVFYYIGITPENEIGLFAGKWKNNSEKRNLWDFCFGTQDYAKANWTKEHMILVTYLQNHSESFQPLRRNWYFAKNSKGELQIGYEYFHEFCSEYGFFSSPEELLKVSRVFTDEHLLKFLFPPKDGDYSNLV